MNKRANHVAKNKSEMNHYNSQIKKLDYDPTVDENLDFKNSNDPEIPEIEDFENIRVQNEPFKNKIARHFRKNLFQWISGIIIAVLSVFFISYTWILAETRSDVNYYHEDTLELKEATSKIEELIVDQYSQIQNNIDSLKSNINENNVNIIDRIHKNELEITKVKTIQELSGNQNNNRVEN